MLLHIQHGETIMNDSQFVCVPISADLYHQLVLRYGDPARDISGIIENVISDYIDRTEEDAGWSASYQEWRAGTHDLEAFQKEYGDPKRGYQWTTLFLPNGTRISMNYKGRTHHAVVRREQIWLDQDGRSYSPSELARVIANNTSRNAWRDLMIKRPSDSGWKLADDLRKSGV
jgi:hypothetical protein